MTILITGAAGFIGMHTAARLMREGHRVLGIDNFNPYYDPGLKRDRIARLEQDPAFEFREVDLTGTEACAELFDATRYSQVIHLAAQPGVRYSLVNPRAYAANNLSAFLNVLEGCRAQSCPHLIYASTSSVYGATHSLPFSESDSVDLPVSLYAATKKANELMAHSYSHVYGLPTTGLRFFTVYGPWGRPDMAPCLFAAAIIAGEPIKVFNYGHMRRDFTYVDDIVEGMVQLLDRLPDPHPVSQAPYAIYNIGNHQPVELEVFIGELERALGMKAVKQYQPMQAGDMAATYADISRLSALTGFAPSTALPEGIDRFVHWYRNYYGAEQDG